jgi:prepilin-type processing-associated H-X9-DG protein
MGLALHNYETANGVFPPGAIRWGSGAAEDCVSPRHHTMFALILGYMEESTVYNSINFNLGSIDTNGPFGNGVNSAASNSTGYNTTISSYLCPSDNIAKFQTPTLIPAFAQSSYGAVVGNVDVNHWWWNCPAFPSPQMMGDGMFDADYVYRVSDVTDGLSNTLFIGETSRFTNDPDGTFFYSWTNDQWWGSSVAGVSRIDSYAYTLAKPNAPMLVPDIGGDATFFQNWQQNPNLQLQNMGQWGFRSQHPGGLNFLFGDGSCHFIKSSINVVGSINPTNGTLGLGVYRQLGTRQGGEVIDSSTY